MKTKLIEKINSSFLKIMTLEKELNKIYRVDKEVDKSQKIELGSIVLNMQQANTEFFTTIDLFLEFTDGSLKDISKEAEEYYNKAIELKKPISEQDVEEIKKFKEYINSIKN